MTDCRLQKSLAISIAAVEYWIAQASMGNVRNCIGYRLHWFRYSPLELRFDAFAGGLALLVPRDTPSSLGSTYWNRPARPLKPGPSHNPLWSWYRKRDLGERTPIRPTKQECKSNHQTHCRLPQAHLLIFH